MSERRPDSDMDDDKTVVRQEPNDDKTNVRQSGPEQPEPAAAAGTDETIIRGSDKPAESEKPAENDSATILRDPVQSSGAESSGNATIIREPNSSNQTATILRGTTRGDSATILRGSASDSSTILREPGRGAPTDDATVMRGGNDGGGDDATIINAGHDDDSTVMAGGKPRGADTTYVASAGRPTQSRGNSEAGRLLKNRFVLEEKVGSGGMGDVYKALDLRQQEAQERNPYIAIKILNEHFARHKDAFISLQREATRTRGIPHPNIMAVYDFDREGDTVFMSMELLDGKPLDDYLKEHPEGVSVEDAWNIIDGICQGLARAHGANIVHSDFKPGNIYYTDDKLAKVFDFGIARAVSNPNDLQADGEKTVFDAGSLGALTPTYASYEMLTGKEPTKSDDVYAVALVAYELFTGRHPYNRTPADKALE
ncbi:MAG TPA: serine/threonine-protein kinase, partial [Pseudomonadales bacterium]|nr:serine/threonine-protein kinase [Pseudomonadales bacterium]